MEVVRMLLIEASPKRGIVRTKYEFLPAVRSEPVDCAGD